MISYSNGETVRIHKKKTTRKNNRPIKISSTTTVFFSFWLRILKRALKSKLYFKICLLEN